MKYIYYVILTILLIDYGCDLLNPDELENITFYVDGKTIKIYGLFDSPYEIEIPYGSTSFDITVKRDDKSHNLNFSEIIWSINQVYSGGSYNSEIASFVVLIDGHHFSYNRLHIYSDRMYLNPDIGDLAVSPPDSTQFYAVGGIGDITWLIKQNQSGAKINQNGLYSAGSKGMAQDIIQCLDVENHSALANIYIAGSYSMEREFDVAHAGFLVWNNLDLWLMELNKLYKVDPVTGISEIDTISLDLPSFSMSGITFDGTNYWVLYFYSVDSTNLYKLNMDGHLINTYSLKNIKEYFPNVEYSLSGIAWDGDNFWIYWQNEEWGDEHDFRLIKMSANIQIIEDIKIRPSDHFDINNHKQYRPYLMGLTCISNKVFGIGNRISVLTLEEFGYPPQIYRENTYYYIKGNGIAWDGEFLWVLGSASLNEYKLMKIRPVGF